MLRAQAELDLPRITVIGNQSAGKLNLTQSLKITVEDNVLFNRKVERCRGYIGGMSSLLYVVNLTISRFIYQINVPRDLETCTRCPIECRMSSSLKTWTCQIYIRWEFTEHGQRRDDVTEEPFGDLITKKEDVELALRQAQAAVLNPKVTSDQFLHMDEQDIKGFQCGEKSLSFSRNAVCIDLEGPDLTDLSFIDLPGTP